MVSRGSFFPPLQSEFFPAQHHEKKKAIRAGPWGGSGGSSSFDLGSHPGRLVAIKIRGTGCIDSIAFLFERDGGSHWTPFYGGQGGQPREIVFEPGEYLIGISGHQGIYNNYFVIKSLTFHTNMSKYGPFGTESGHPFSVTNGEIVSFFGRSATPGYLDALGVYVISV